MKEHIEREVVLNLIDRYRQQAYMANFTDIALWLGSVYREIDNIPTADVRSVVRGKWETVMLDHQRIGCRPTAHYCSECHQITWFRTFFCHNCGADMREETDGR